MSFFEDMKKNLAEVIAIKEGKVEVAEVSNMAAPTFRVLSHKKRSSANDIASSAKPLVYGRPNMNNLKGKKGRAVLEEIRNMKAPSYDDIKGEADECMERIKKKRKEEERFVQK